MERTVDGAAMECLKIRSCSLGRNEKRCWKPQNTWQTFRRAGLESDTYWIKVRNFTRWPNLFGSL